MKLTVFQSGGGDCLLLTGEDERRLLIDGDMVGTYQKHVAPYLNALQQAEVELDVVYVSHIDEDHISGILRMLEDIVDWRVYDIKIARGDKAKKPRSLRPPEVNEIWHNAIRATVPGLSAQIEEMLASRVSVLAGGRTNETLKLAELEQNLATGVKQAIELANRISPRQLGIPLNTPSNGGLMLAPNGDGTGTPGSIQLGCMSIYILGPSQEEITELTKEWEAWLKKEPKVLEKLAEEATKDQRDLHASEVEIIVEAALTQADAFGMRLAQEIGLGTPITEIEDLGKRSGVTTPNLASLMLLVEEGEGDKKKRILLTGDGHWEDIVKGLKSHNLLDAKGKLHVDLLKVQHHGSKYNINLDFCKHITADHYVFCSNGAHDNPHELVLKAIVRARRGDDLPFTFWFNSHSSVSTYSKYMRRIMRWAEKHAAESGGRLTVNFLKDSYFEIEIRAQE